MRENKMGEIKTIGWNIGRSQAIWRQKVLYYFLMPGSIPKQIDKRRKTCFWGGGVNKTRFITLVTWRCNEMKKLI